MRLADMSQTAALATDDAEIGRGSARLGHDGDRGSAALRWLRPQEGGEALRSVRTTDTPSGALSVSPVGPSPGRRRWAALLLVVLAAGLIALVANGMGSHLADTCGDFEGVVCGP